MKLERYFTPNHDTITAETYPLGSIPREANSLRITRLIQAEIEASPSISTALLTAFSSSGSILKATCLLPLGKFTLFVFDTCISPMYYLKSVKHCKTRDINKQASNVVATQLEALIINLKRSKIMTENHYTGLLCLKKATSQQRENTCFHLNTKLKTPLQTLAKSFMLNTQSQNRLPSVETRTNTRRTVARLLTRAFFVRSLRTPKITLATGLFSMVGRIGQRLIVGCIPCITVFHPDTSYRQAWKLAVVPKALNTELSSMIYKFLVLGEKRLTIRIRANTETEARQQLQFTRPALCIARFNEKGGLYA